MKIVIGAISTTRNKRLEIRSLNLEVLIMCQQFSIYSLAIVLPIEALQKGRKNFHFFSASSSFLIFLADRLI